MDSNAANRSDPDALVRDALAAVAPDADLAALDPTRPFRDQIEIDSVDFLNMIIRIERRLGVRIPELDYPRFSTLDGCRVYLKRLTASP